MNDNWLGPQPQQPNTPQQRERTQRYISQPIPQQPIEQKIQVGARVLFGLFCFIAMIAIIISFITNLN